MSNSNNKVSVIIPTYKRDIKLLSRALNSVINQTYKNIEIIIVDDNPPDSEYRKQVMSFMHQYEHDNKVKYIMNKYNAGGSIARNIGINAATGNYIAFLDDDDEYLPEKIKKQLTFMVDNDCDMSFTNLKLVNTNKSVIDYREYHSIAKFDKENLLRYHLTRQITGTPTFMYKTEKLKEIQGFTDVKMGQEFYLMFKTIIHGMKIMYLDDCDVLAYRHAEGGISQGRNKIEGENAIYNFKKTHFNILSKKEITFIKFRHYAVMAVAYKRNRKYLFSFANMFKMFFVSPANSFKEVSKFIKHILKLRYFEKNKRY